VPTPSDACFGLILVPVNIFLDVLGEVQASDDDPSVSESVADSVLQGKLTMR
jgi:hypothetical protein